MVLENTESHGNGRKEQYDMKEQLWSLVFKQESHCYPKERRVASEEGPGHLSQDFCVERHCAELTLTFHMTLPMVQFDPHR